METLHVNRDKDDFIEESKKLMRYMKELSSSRRSVRMQNQTKKKMNSCKGSMNSLEVSALLLN